jgi:glycosyltransferase involved in cell wall biosynthesis
MRVGVNALFLIPGEVGGTEVYLRHLLPALTVLDPGLELVLFTNRENHDSFAGFQRVALGVSARSRPRRILAEQWALPRAARAQDLDLLFSPGYTAPFRCSVPQVVTIHDVQFCAFPEDFSWIALQAHRFFVTRAARAAQVVLTVSEFSRAEIQHHLHVNPEHIAVAHEAPAEMVEESPDPPETPGIEPYLTGERPFLLYVANTYPHKNAARLRAAFLRLADAIPHDLVIVGQPGRGEPDPHPRLKRFHRVTTQELRTLYGACALFVFPSLYEGFGLPVVEALDAGARVVAARAAAIPEVAGEAASYMDPYDEEAMATAIKKALDEPLDCRQAFHEAARTQADSFSWRQCAQGTLDAFGRALH